MNDLSFSEDLAVSYGLFSDAHNVQMIGSKTMDEWIEKIRYNYQHEAPVEEVKKFFRIDGVEFDELISHRLYTVSVIVLNHSLEQRIFTIRLTLSFINKK